MTNTAVLANNPSARSARAKAKENKILIQSLLKEPEVPDEIVPNEIVPNEKNEPSVKRNEIQEITRELKNKMYV